MANLATISNNILADSGIDPINLIVGTGTVNYVPKFTGEDTLAISQIFDNGTNVGIGTSSPSGQFHTYTNGYKQLLLTYPSTFASRLTIGSSQFYIENDASPETSTFVNSTGTGTFIWKGGSSATERMRLTSTGLGIGTSSPNTKLEIGGEASPIFRITSTSGPYSQIQSNTAGTLQLMADEGNTGASTSMRFRIDGAEVMRLDASGNLGLGVIPSAWNSAYKAIQFGTTGAIFGESGDAANYFTTNTFIDSVGFKYITTDFALGYFQENGVHSWRTAASGTAGNAISFTQAMTLDASGRLGIGTTSPAVKLDVLSVGADAINIGAGNDFSGLRLTSDAGTWAIRTSIADALFFYDVSSAAERMRITSGGNVGIGTTSPTGLLHLYGTDPAFRIQNSGTGNMQFGQWDGTNNKIQSSGRDFSLWGTDAYAIIFGTSATERMRITSGGNVGIGTTSPSDKLHVSGNLRVTGTIVDSNNSPGTSGQVLSSTGTGTDWVSLSEITGVDGTGTANYIAKWQDANTIQNSIIYDSGTNVGIGTASPGAKLEIAGTDENVLKLKNTGGQPALVRFNDTSTSADPYVGSYGNALAFGIYGVGESMRITSSRNVGIGTTSPLTKLHVNGSITAEYSDSIYLDYSPSAGSYKKGFSGLNQSTSVARGLHIFNYDNDSNQGINFWVGTNAARLQAAVIKNNRQILLNAYGSGSFTGTVAYNLAVDASGNVIETAGGVVDGSGTANYVPRWQDANTLTNSIIYDSGSSIGVGTTNAIQPLTVAAIANASTVALLGRSLDNASRIDFYNNAGNSRIFTIALGSQAEFYADTNIPIIFSTNASERMRITSAGNVGIGYSNPDYPLTVSSINLGGVGANLGIILSNVINTAIPSSSVKAQIGVTNSGFGYSAGSLLIQPRTGVSAVIAFATEGTEKVRIDSSGNVGIGATSPASKLTIDGNISNVASQIQLVGTGVLSGYIGPSADGLNFGTDSGGLLFRTGVTGNASVTTGTERMRINGSGNVGIGTTSPSRKLSISDGYAYMDFKSTNIGTRTYTVGSDLYGFIIYDDTAGSYRVSINSTGNVGIGTTSPSYDLHISKATNEPGIGITSSAAGGRTYRLFVNPSWGSGQFQVYDATADASRISVFSNGNVAINTITDANYKFYVNGTAYINSNFTVNGTITELSSEKLKTDIQSIDKSLTKVEMLRPVTYKKIGGERTEIGLIAEEVEKIYPELVEYTSSGEVLGLNYSRLTAVLIESVKELNNRIQELEKRN